jgi:hypothetical protein
MAGHKWGELRGIGSCRHDSDCIASQNKPVTSIQSEFAFVPMVLIDRCRLVVSQHGSGRSYTRLPDILWRARLEKYAEVSDAVRMALKKASTTRSAKTRNEGFSCLASVVMSLEILVTNFARWGELFPNAAADALVFFELAKLERTAPMTVHFLTQPRPDAWASLAPDNVSVTSVVDSRSFRPDYSN